MGISALASFRIHAASYGSTIPQSFLSSVLAETQVKCTYGVSGLVKSSNSNSTHHLLQRPLTCCHGSAAILLFRLRSRLPVRNSSCNSKDNYFTYMIEKEVL